MVRPDSTKIKQTSLQCYMTYIAFIVLRIFDTCYMHMKPPARHVIYWVKQT